MTQDCPVCSQGREEVCIECKRPVPVLYNPFSRQTMYVCLRRDCPESGLVKYAGDGKVRIRLCETCKILGPAGRQAIENKRFSRSN